MPTIFFDFDSTVCTRESLDEVIALALKEYPDQEGLVGQVEAITNQGMNGEIDFKESVRARFKICPLNKAHFLLTGQHLKHCLTPGFKDLFEWLKQNQWNIYIVSGGFMPSIAPAIEHLGLRIDRLFTNGLRFDEGGNVTGPDESSLLWTNHGKTQVINYLKDAQKLTGPLVLVGDGSNDLAAFKAGVVDHFIGFGGNVVRPKVKSAAPNFVTKAEDLIPLLKAL
jgi:D-3-phosphoglycerate dehydrogenase